MLIVPCRLRIVGYSPSVVPGYEDRPTIHVEGDMGGPGWSDIWEDTRKLHGTVGIIADGSVRWSLVSFSFPYPSGMEIINALMLAKYSTENGSDEDQWVSEAIQVGGVGSGMGTLGMWTGATHESTDPLGERLSLSSISTNDSWVIFIRQLVLMFNRSFVVPRHRVISHCRTILGMESDLID